MPGCFVCEAKGYHTLHGQDEGAQFYPIVCNNHLVAAALALHGAFEGSMTMEEIVTRVLVDRTKWQESGEPITEAEWQRMLEAYGVWRRSE